MKPLKILIVDNEKKKAEDLVSKLGLQSSKYLNNIDLSFEVPSGREFHTIVHEKKPVKGYDLLILSDNLNGQGARPIATKIKQESLVPILLNVSNKGTNKRQLIEFVNSRDKKGRSIVNGYLMEDYSSIKSQEIIRENLIRPLKIGVIGLGDFGVGFLDYFCQFPEVAELKGFSRRIKPNNEPIVDYEQIYKNLDEIRLDNSNYISKIRLEDTLEEAVKDTDCVVLCTSEYGGRKIAQNLDRSDLLAVHGEKIFNVGKELSNLDYLGLVLIASNPVGNSMRLLNQAGLKEDQLTSPLSIDYERFIRSYFKLMEQEEISDLPIPIPGMIVGHHGASKFSNVSSKNYKLIRKALQMSHEMGKEVMESSEESGRPYSKSVWAFKSLIESMAHFRDPEYAAYCFSDINDVHGPIGVEAKFTRYFEHRIAPNVKSIINFDPRVRKELAREMKDQESVFNKFMNNYTNLKK
jgi:hypothetical protein